MGSEDKREPNDDYSVARRMLKEERSRIKRNFLFKAQEELANEVDVSRCIALKQKIDQLEVELERIAIELEQYGG